MSAPDRSKLPLPRPCKIDGHQYVATGYCWALTPSGIALVETESGSVTRYDLTQSVYSLTFTDVERFRG